MYACMYVCTYACILYVYSMYVCVHVGTEMSDIDNMPTNIGSSMHIHTDTMKNTTLRTYCYTAGASISLAVLFKFLIVATRTCTDYLSINFPLQALHESLLVVGQCQNLQAQTLPSCEFFAHLSVLIGKGRQAPRTCRVRTCALFGLGRFAPYIGITLRIYYGTVPRYPSPGLCGAVV